MKYLICLILVVAPLLCMQWQNCNDGKQYFFDVLSMTLSPDPVEVGKPAVVTLSGNLNIAVREATATMFINVKVGDDYKPIVGNPFVVDVCRYLECPMTPGPVTKTVTIDVPSITPPAFYKGNLTIAGGPINYACINWAAQMVASE